MSANVETMAYVKFDERDVPWHGLGTPCDHAMSSVEALELSGLNWNVVSKKLYIHDSKYLEVPEMLANTRDSDNTVLGVVTGKYKICQNKEAFDFTDELLNHNVTYETAGSLNNGKRVWMLAKMPEIEIVGDKVEPYLVFTNNHDGKGSITVAAVSIRIVCQNTLNLALNSARRVWSTKHMGDLNSKKAEAINTLNLATKYNEHLKQVAEKLVKEKITNQQFTYFVREFIPTKEDMTERKIKNIEFMRNDLTERFMKAPDIENFRFTKWGLINAVSDYIYHAPAVRSSEKYDVKTFEKAIDGNSKMDIAYELIQNI